MVFQGMLILTACACVAVTLFGMLMCLIGLESLTSGNPAPWLFWCFVLVVLPAGGAVFCFRALRRNKQN